MATSRSGTGAQKVTLTAVRGQVRRDATLEVAAAPSGPSNPGPSNPGPSNPPSAPAPKVSGLLVDPSSIKTGETATGKVTLDRKAGDGGVQVALTAPSGAAYVKFPASVTVPAGQAEASFQITGEAPAVDPVRTTATLAAATGGASVSADLIVVPPFALRSVSVPVKIYEREWRLDAKVTANVIKFAVTVPEPADADYPIEVNTDSRCGCTDVSALFANPPVLKAGQKVEFEVPVTPFSRSFALTVTIASADHELVWEGVWS